MKYLYLATIVAVLFFYSFFSIDSIIETMNNTKTTFAYLLGELTLKMLIFVVLIKFSTKTFQRFRKKSNNRYSLK